MGERSLAEAYILGIPFGLFGAHHFYLRRKFFGFLYLFTFGLLGIGYLCDLVRMKWLVLYANKNRNNPEKKILSDCYLLGAVGGMVGAHHFYLGNPRLGMVYACTLGVFTIGWIVDLVRMRKLLDDHSIQDKSLVTAYILGVSPLGIFGAHHYYLGNVERGFVYTSTYGIFGAGWIVDLFRMRTIASGAEQDRVSVGTAYIIALPPFGILGAHHYYLGNYGLGVTYTLTGGLFGFGWIGDLFRMKNIVAASNDANRVLMMKLITYTLCMSPLGLFGLHHFYLKRYLSGGLFAATLGLFGFGWLFDWLRIRVLYWRFELNGEHKYLDDAYLFWFPFGIFGLHQFYLGRNRWGLLYACTLGCLGVGWIVDGFRLPSLVADYNSNVNDHNMVEFKICQSRSKAEKRAKTDISTHIPDNFRNDLREMREIYIVPQSGLNDDQGNASNLEATSTA